jgi:L-histidine Nalpha-methyltransferase
VGTAHQGDRRPHLALDRASTNVTHRGCLKNGFLQDVIAGLSLPQKALPPKYFYDAAGSKLFEKICRLPEYYLTRAELELTRRNIGALARFAGRRCELIEYGSGESVKTRLLVRALRPAAYLPVDISAAALDLATRKLAREFPWLKIIPLTADFSRPIQIPVMNAKARRVVYFPGSTIGNFTPEESHAFLRMTRGQVGPEGAMLVGVDLKKDPAILHAAYNDSRSVTATFNLNLLARASRELGADFDLRRWRHYAFYNAPLGRIEMHLASLKRQTVNVSAYRFSFETGETIHTENSYKYSVEEFRALAARAGFLGKHLWTDSKGLFALHGLTAA